MGNFIIIVILLIVFVAAAKSSRKHFNGEGSCCGGGDSPQKVRAEKIKVIVFRKTVKIEGMTCEHCSSRIQNALNAIDMINAKVNLKRGEAYLDLGREVSNEEIKNAIEELGYKVTDISDR